MSTSALFAALLVGAGLAAVVVGFLLRGRERTEELVRILDLPFGERDVPVEAITEKSALVEGTVGLAGRMISSVDTRGSLAESLERAKIPMKPGEYVVFAICAAIVLAALLVAVTEQWMFAVLGVGGALAAAKAAPGFLIARRRKSLLGAMDAVVLTRGEAPGEQHERGRCLKQPRLATGRAPRVAQQPLMLQRTHDALFDSGSRIQFARQVAVGLVGPSIQIVFGYGHGDSPLTREAFAGARYARIVLRAANNWLFDVPTATPRRSAISPWVSPSTSCSTSTTRWPSGRRDSADSRSSRSPTGAACVCNVAASIESNNRLPFRRHHVRVSLMAIPVIQVENVASHRNRGSARTACSQTSWRTSSASSF